MRRVSSNFLKAVYDGDTDEVFIALITITHPALTEPMRVGSDAVNTTSRGNLFVGYPYELTLPTDEEGSPPTTRISIDNVSQEICDALRSIDSPAEFLVEVVRFSEPDIVEAQWPYFQLKNIKADILVVQGDLYIEDVILEPFPAGIFSPSRFRGLFAQS